MISKPKPTEPDNSTGQGADSPRSAGAVDAAPALLGPGQSPQGNGAAQYPRWISPNGKIELRCGRWQDVLADVTRVDAVITDPPYSERTHDGHRDGVGLTGSGNPCERRVLCYAAWGREDVGSVFDFAGVVGAGWVVAMSDDILAAAYREEAAAAGRVTFAPIPWLAPGSRVRLAGDGPSCWVVWINVSRPRMEPWSKWGSLPGGYVFTQDSGAHIGGKPLKLMRALVRDYSRPGDLICDPCAGGGTTLLAAALEGRRAIGAEMDPKTYALAVDRLRGWGPMKSEGQLNLLKGQAR